MASDPERPRSAGRHAAPRITVRGRMQLPVGRALALTAVPTALIMGSLAPKFAFAADAAKAAPVSSTVQEVVKGSNGADCTTPSAAPTSAAKSSTAKAPAAKKSTTAKSSTMAKSSTGKTATTPEQHTVPTATPTPSATATPTHRAAPPADPIKTILDGLGGLLVPKATQPAATAAPKAAASTRAAAAPTATPTATATPTPDRTVKATATPSAPSASSSKSATPSSSASAKAQANRVCDVSKLAAPMDAAAPTGGMPAVPWTLKTSRLALGNTQFWGVKTVDTAAGPVRVLKFTSQTVQIDNLDMSANQNGQLLHVQGGPNTTSTMTGGTVTMYVTSLSGTLSKAEGIPLAELGIKLTLTPDTLPEWLYNLIGSVPIPLNLELNDATAIQAGQFGGNLTIPGMHLYYTALS
ncbi:hypothetical protein ACEZDB_04545 [Streptacidiphilus sp. N1-3]|uniref:Uncharacterized protein n=1 Tax=Streptacidiphilus alkalitolerans TaxID=3342712 RepID=A0ABV6WVG2_9ACTN